MLKSGIVVNTIPTIGFNVETIYHGSVGFTVWDVCSADKLRPLYVHYTKDARGVIFVVDSSDRERIDEAKQVLHESLVAITNNDVALLIFANKQDKPDAMTTEELTEKLNLKSLNDRKVSNSMTQFYLIRLLPYLANFCIRFSGIYKPAVQL